MSDNSIPCSSSMYFPVAAVIPAVRQAAPVAVAIGEGSPINNPQVVVKDPKNVDLTPPAEPPDGQPIGTDGDWDWRD